MEPNSQSTETCNCCRIKQEEQKILFARNGELLQTITELSLQRDELHERLNNKDLKLQETQKQKEELVEYYGPQFQFLLKENKELSNELSESNRSPNLDQPSQIIYYSSFTSSASDPEDENQLEKFLSAGENVDVYINADNLLRKLEAVKGFVLRDRAKKQVMMRLIAEDAKKTENQLLDDIRERDERLTSTQRQLEGLKTVFNDVSTKLASEVDSLKADLEKAKKGNLRLRNSNQTTKIIKTCSDSADVDDIDESTLSGSDSPSTGIAYDCNSADTASIITDFSSSSVADSSNSTTLTTCTVTPMLNRVILYGKSPNSELKRKEILSDGEDVSKKLKSSIDVIDLTSHDDEISNESEKETNHRIMALERDVSYQKNKLAAAMVELQQALNKINVQENISNKIDGSPNTGLDQTAHWNKTEDNVTLSPPVLPITREEARTFSCVEEYLFAAFSEFHYANASRNSSFLVNKPIGIDNPGRNFCYMNSVVQALSCIPLFAVKLVCGVDSEEGSLLHALYQTYRHVWVRRPDAWNSNRPSVLDTKEIRSYYTQYHSIKFDPTRQHDAQEFLEDLISNLECEMSQNCGFVEEDNFVTRLFRGYIVAPDGTKEYFRNLRLSIEDEKIHSVKDALLYHLLSWSPRAVPLDMTVPVSSSSSTANFAQGENFTIPEKSDELSQVEKEKNVLAQYTSPTGEIYYVQMPNIATTDHDAKLASLGSTETISTCDGTVDCDSHQKEDLISNLIHQKEDSVLDTFSVETLIRRKSIKIYTPDILCISLNRHKIDYSYNYKVLPAENLTIPADLRAPEGMTIPAHYKLMSLVQYIRAGSSEGHYYTLLNADNGKACMLNDDTITCVEMNQFFLSALDARSIIFVYARIPENLPSI